jgi:hypothetical protein
MALLTDVLSVLLGNSLRYGSYRSQAEVLACQGCRDAALAVPAQANAASPA